MPQPAAKQRQVANQWPEQTERSQNPGTPPDTGRALVGDRGEALSQQAFPGQNPGLLSPKTNTPSLQPVHTIR